MHQLCNYHYFGVEYYRRRQRVRVSRTLPHGVTPLLVDVHTVAFLYHNCNTSRNKILADSLNPLASDASRLRHMSDSAKRGIKRSKKRGNRREKYQVSVESCCISQIISFYPLL